MTFLSFIFMAAVCVGVVQCVSDFSVFLLHAHIICVCVSESLCVCE